jgi:hypothetical protein
MAFLATEGHAWPLLTSVLKFDGVQGILEVKLASTYSLLELDGVYSRLKATLGLSLPLSLSLMAFIAA